MYKIWSSSGTILWVFFLSQQRKKLTVFLIKARVLVNVSFPLPSTPARLGFGVHCWGGADRGSQVSSALAVIEFRKKTNLRAICSSFSEVHRSWQLNYLFCENYFNLLECLSYVPRNPGSVKRCFQLQIIICDFCNTFS